MRRGLWLMVVCAACGSGERRGSSSGSSGGGGATSASQATTGSGIGDDLGPVQCRTDADCAAAGPEAYCAAMFPGGVCIDCDAATGVCPSGTTCISDASGALCVRDCTTNEDCNIGMQCDPAMGQCVMQSCAECPAPYVCINGTRCLRPSCAQDPSCPAPLVCNETDFCVEP